MLLTRQFSYPECLKKLILIKKINRIHITYVSVIVKYITLTVVPLHSYIIYSYFIK